jgi:hypothetical protein
MTEVFDAIASEREYQKQKWSKEYDDKDWTPEQWAGFILEYLPSKDNPVPLRHPDYDFRKQLVKVAALATAALEVMGLPS